MSATEFHIEVQPSIPARLARLTDLANDLRYSWDRQTRSLFARLNRDLWAEVGHNPKVFLRRVEERRLQQAAEDAVYLDTYDQVVARYDTYVSDPPRRNGASLAPEDLVAYFSAEFGFHESFQIYSGGLGVLAADHCKSASDLGLPFVAVGLLYRQGYFTQTIDADGRQIATYTPTDFADLPLAPARDSAGGELRVRVAIAGHDVALRVWVARAGRVKLLLLDADLPENSDADRQITYQLYGGDVETRIKQEIVLGIGGVRAIRALGLAPTVWHINEGHAAFSMLERCREQVAAGLDFAGALEATAGTTIFTTHTPVESGHDIFTVELVERSLKDIVEAVGLSTADVAALGETPNYPNLFNQTALAIRASRYQNGVSRIHRQTSALLCAPLWPQVPPDENPMSYVTNGVHVGTFLAREWVDTFDTSLGSEWRGSLADADFWRRIETIPDQLYWSVRQAIKAALMNDLRARLRRQYRRNGASETQINHLLRLLNPEEPDVLLVGFARRFATYKRATLLLVDRPRLARLVGNADRPIVFVFAGKAHPADVAAQEMIHELFALTRDPAFEGRILIVEGYDMSLARKMVSGVDVWLNTPRFPMEASGTSGQKAGMNGVINLSVLDGWWGEGFDGANGWAIPPFPVEADIDRRDREEAANLYDILEQEVLPLYYERHGSHGFSKAWVEKSKRSMRTLLPRFSSTRMVTEYSHSFYKAASAHGRALNAGGFAGAKELAAWKARVRKARSGTSLRLLAQPQSVLRFGSETRIEVAVKLNGLSTKDVRVECLFGDRAYPFTDAGALPDGEHRMTLDLHPESCGLVTYRIRMYPYHELLAHPHEVGLMIWLSQDAA
jgi:glycogen phosphorylase